MNRFMASLFIACIAAMIGFDAGLPAWRNWPGGDVSDFAVFGFLATWFLIRAVQTTVIVNNYGAASVDTDRMAETPLGGSGRSLGSAVPATPGDAQ